ncbi:alpha-1,2-galactosyltransferase [Schizosaccharomyces japonicus yFS275]|uniref:Alpha-1,2-galactosyltransferase n=1 Tax=Schizosaccharomyces japonicus (strain yFS275 / FY16936) TaxID=402676 RepID=B6K4J4_SCHJY|nr:alpha-1,2-galactosyltransferase [Schizosaccharomyces japonicus yFS275]EEB08401.1 alpha-1,2-galactosyltransferase [Schizosaccharomyces japonicus yFS275]
MELSFRSRRTRLVVVCCVSILCLFYFLKNLTIGDFSNAAKKQFLARNRVIQNRNPYSVVMLLVTDSSENENDPHYQDHVEKLIENRRRYAALHGYKFEHKRSGDYGLFEHDSSNWAVIPAIRDVLEEHPECEWVWYLTPHAIIMNPFESLKDKLLEPSQLSRYSLRDHPVNPVGPSVRTSSIIDPNAIDLITTQDYEGINTRSFLLRNNDYAEFLLDVWNEPLYRMAPFEHGERGVLEYLLQRHPTILSKLAFVSTRVMNSYTSSPAGLEYREGDFVLLLSDCDSYQTCKKSFEQYWRDRKQSAKMKILIDS